MAINDINKQAPTHIIIFPVKPIARLSEAEESDKDILGHLLLVARRIAREKQLDGFRIVINDGKSGGQSIYHLHVHLISGRNMKWPPG
ncbi:hypothetical protein MHBO_001035 [Bonamia ostreae]